MKQLLFIDANIYLRFYDSNNENYKKLLQTLPSVRNRIFITKQIQFEIERNKAEVFRRSFDQYLKQADYTTNIKLPEHLDSSNSPEIASWNEERSQLIAKLKDSKKSLQNIYTQKITAIAKSEDEASKMLLSIYHKSKEATDIELAKAQLRKERGNPPGKPDNAMGDQINWEQLLSIVQDIDELYFVSNDKDFYSYSDEVILLNPLLYQELVEKNTRLEIKCFVSLANALTSLDASNSMKIQNLPSREVLEQIDFVENINYNNKGLGLSNLDEEQMQGLLLHLKNDTISNEDFIEICETLNFPLHLALLLVQFVDASKKKILTGEIKINDLKNAR